MPIAFSTSTPSWNPGTRVSTSARSRAPEARSSSRSRTVTTPGVSRTVRARPEATAVSRESCASSANRSSSPGASWAGTAAGDASSRAQRAVRRMGPPTSANDLGAGWSGAAELQHVEDPRVDGQLAGHEVDGDLPAAARLGVGGEARRLAPDGAEVRRDGQERARARHAVEEADQRDAPLEGGRHHELHELGPGQARVGEDPDGVGVLERAPEHSREV